MKLLNVVILSSALAFGATAFAGSDLTNGAPQGFEQTALGTVAAVKKDARDDQWVTLRGRLVDYLGHDKYEFADSTGSIEVELDDDRDWSYISKGELIELSGKVDKDLLSMKVEAKKIISLEKAPVPGATGAQGFEQAK